MINLKLRNIKPLAATMKEWREWETRVRSEEPFRYWLNETVPDFFHDLGKSIMAPYHNTRQWIRHNFFDKYHVINTGLKPGYYDSDTRMLNGMFALLVDFVEVEKAWIHVVFDKEARTTFTYPWYSLGWLRFKSFRNPAAGIAHLAWEMSLDDPNLDEYSQSPSQAASAREQLALYDWWTNIRPNRIDPYDASGWTDYCERSRAENGKYYLWEDERSPEDTAISQASLNKLHEIEQAYEAEDEEMLIRLIRVRRHLWT